MVGLGETFDEVVDLMHDLRSVSCDIMTIGQYLQPHARRLPVERYVTPEEFAKWRENRNVTRFPSRRIEPAHAFLLSRTRTSREMKATIFKQHGGPDVLEYTDVPDSDHSCKRSAGRSQSVCAESSRRLCSQRIAGYSDFHFRTFWDVTSRGS
jgi:hypothetical protein